MIAIAAVFFYYVYRTSGEGGVASGYRVVAEFDNVGAIDVGTDVRLAGIKIGTVEAQELNPQSFQARVTMSIDPAIRLADDSSAKVTNEGLLGGAFIALEPGGAETKIENGGEIANTQGAIDIWKLVTEAMFSKPPTSSDPPQ
ncbi:MAG: outer membrane lipid asymmetry maintenance protein MlaD [Pseudomonadota bacterium]|nr:outer membrane lipid asymmetry maintenance protein MlaD [Pseudomonadota bacterium]